MDLRTNYQTKKLQEKVIVQSDNLKDDKSDASPISDEGTVFFPNEDETNTAQDNTSDGGILLKFTQLYNENPDFAGWLRIPGTKIDYPVMSRRVTIIIILTRILNNNMIRMDC